MVAFFRPFSWLAMASLAVLSATAANAGTVEVRFIEPQHFRDAGRSTLDIERNTRILGEQLQKLGKKLPEGQTLKVDVLDVDLAGELKPTASNELRILRGAADWPQIKLRYTLSDNGRELKSGEERLSDMNYLQDRLRAGGSQEMLAYDRHMIDTWFDKRFVAP